MRISRLSLKLIGIVIVAACVSVLVFWMLFFNRYRMFYMFNDKSAIEKQTSEQIKTLQSNITDKNISKEDSKNIQKEMHKFKGLTMFLYDGEADVDREYLISNLENKAYIQTSSFMVRLYEPLSKQYDLHFYDGTYTLYVDSYQGVVFMIRYLIIICAFAVLLFISIIMIYVHRKMRYVLEIGDEMKLIENGDYHHTIMYKGSDEITDLAKQLNHLRSALYENMSKEEDARKANEELVTAMSHDLRTPLTSLIGYLDIVDLKIYKTDEEKDKYIHKSKEKAAQIKGMSDRLFNHFLVYAQNDDVDLSTFTQDDIKGLLGLFCDDLKERHIKVYEAFDKQPFQIRADHKLMNRIYDNLLSNICKYAEKDMVVVSLSVHQGLVTIKVKNKKKKDATKEESTHIGLKSITKMMKEMGGNVSIDQDMDCFSIELIFPCREIHKA
ncbi:MAG: HAMP domain-containing sensor histidine kinase [Longicatena sp.]